METLDGGQSCTLWLIEVDLPHIRASSMKHENRQSQASFPPSVGGRENPSFVTSGVVASSPVGSSSISVTDEVVDCCRWGATARVELIFAMDSVVWITMHLIVDRLTLIHLLNATSD